MVKEGKSSLPTDLPCNLPMQTPLKFSSIALSEIMAFGARLEASVFDMTARRARMAIEHGKYPALPLIGPGSPVASAHYGGRLKRTYVASSQPGALGFIGSSEMLDCYPKPVKYLPPSPEYSDLRVNYGDVLISRSGTIGNLAFVGKTLARLLVSEHAIRLTGCAYPGYIYAYLSSSIGQTLIQSLVYGSVVSQIEPEHLAAIPVPDPPAPHKKRINDLIVKSYELRDEANELIDEATLLLKTELNLPPIQAFNLAPYIKNSPDWAFSRNLGTLARRFDASYHAPLAYAIEDHLKKHAAELVLAGERRISKDIILPGRFKRVYTEPAYGKIFIGGKQIGQLDPVNKKYLSVAKHKERIEGQLELKENMILITCSGTIGKVALAGRHWDGWTASQHIIRIVPASADLPGYLGVFLGSDYGRELIRRHTYGSVIDEIDDTHVAKIPIPLLKNMEAQKQINTLALLAMQKRYEAWQLEQEALGIMEREILD